MMKRHRLFPLFFALITTALVVAPVFPTPVLPDALPQENEGRSDILPPIPAQTYRYNSVYSSYGEADSTRSALPVIVRHFGDWDSHLAMQNVSSSTANVTVSFYADTSTPVYVVSNSVPPFSSWHLDVGALGALGESFRGSAVVSSTAPIRVVDNQVGFGSMAYSGLPDTTGPALSIPNLVYDREGWISYLAVQNVGTVTDTIQVLYTDGITTAVSLPPGSSHLFYQELEGHARGSAFGGFPSAGGPIAATSLLMGSFTDTAAFEPFASADMEATLVQVYRQFFGWSSRLTILNTGMASTTVTISYDGGYFSTREISPSQIAVVDMEGEPVPAGYAGPALLSSSDAPIVVSALSQHVALPSSEDRAFAVAAHLNSLLLQEGASVTRSQPDNLSHSRDTMPTEPLVFNLYAPLSFKGYGPPMAQNPMQIVSWDSSLLVMNLSVVVATVAVTFYSEDGIALVPPLLGGITNPFFLGAGDTQLIHMPDVVLLPDGRYSVVISADEPIIADIWLFGLAQPPTLPDLSVSRKTVTPTAVSAGLPVTFTLTLSNSNAVMADHVRVEDPLPAGLSYISGSLWASEGTYGYQDGIIRWTGDVSASHPITITFAATRDFGLPYETRLTNTASIQWGYLHTSRSAAITVYQKCITLSNPSLAYTPTSPVAGGVVTFTGTAEGSPPFSFTWDFGDGGSGEGAVLTHTYAVGGDYPVSLTATNPCGQEVVTDTVGVCGPVAGAGLSWLPLTPIPGEVVTFSASVSGTPPISFTWSFGDGGGGEGAVLTHAYAVEGDYPVSLTATNPCGQEVATDTVGVCGPVAGANFTWLPLTPTLGEAITFTASASGTPPISFTWDFGDGTTGTGQMTTHIYTATGSYTVTLTMVNACGMEEIRDTLTIILPTWKVYLPLVFKDQVS